MGNKLEQLLNSLIKKWRVPFWDKKIHSFEIIYVTWKIRNIIAKRWRWQVNIHYSIRDIVSKLSWLWQFVCENGMIPKENHERVYDVSWWEYWVDCKAQIISREPEYRLIESALCDEDKLEEFLLNSIKLD